MHPDLAVQMMSDVLRTALALSGPILGLTMLVGVVVSVLQVVTQVQEMSLTFVPKLLTAGVVLLVLGSWMLRQLSEYTTRLWASIPSLF